MKKFFLSILVSAALITSAKAQAHHEVNFLAPVSSLVISNALGFTNLLSTSTIGTTAATTNIVGLIWTNLLGNRVIAAAGDTTALAVDVPLWSTQGGLPPIVTSGSNSVFSGAISGLTVNIHVLTAGSGANSAVNFEFAPLFDGVNETTTATDAWVVGVTAIASSMVDIATNVPMWKFPGAKALRLRRITNTDTDASAQVVVDSITLNGFVP